MRGRRASGLRRRSRRSRRSTARGRGRRPAGAGGAGAGGGASAGGGAGAGGAAGSADPSFEARTPTLDCTFAPGPAVAPVVVDTLLTCGPSGTFMNVAAGAEIAATSRTVNSRPRRAW